MTHSNNISIYQTEMKQIVDFDSIERFTECPCCLEQFKEPRILPCSHTYCTSCLIDLSNLINSSQHSNVDINEDMHIITCPTCNETHKLNSEKRKSIEKFPRNLALKQLIDLKPTQLISDKFCESCNVSYAFTNCLHCLKSVCIQCRDSHRKKLKETIEFNLKNLQLESINFIGDFKHKLKEFLVSSSKAKKLIKLSFNELIKQIKDTENLLYEKIDQQMSYFNKIQTSFVEENLKIHEFITKAEQISKDSVPEDRLLELNKKCDDHLKSIIDFKSKQNLSEIVIDPTDFMNKFTEIKTKIEHLDKLCFITNNQKGNEAIKTQRLFRHDLTYAKLNNIWKGSEDTEYWCPTGLAYNSKLNEIIIADSFNHCLKVLNASDGTQLRCSQNDLLSFNTPRDLFIKNDEEILISDSGNHRICIVNYINFKLIHQFGEYGTNRAQFNNPRGVCVDSYNRIYVCDRDNHRIQVFDYSGLFLFEWGSKGSENGQFFSPEFICISKNNHLLVSDTRNHRIQIFNIDFENTNNENFASFIKQFGGYGKKSSLFRHPRGIITDTEDYIMIADCGNNRLQLFEPDGTFVSEISHRNNELDKRVLFDKPVGIAILNDGGLAVSTWGRSQKIQIL